MKKDEINELLSVGLNEIEGAKDLGDLHHLKVKYIGRHGKISAFIKKLRDLPPDEKKIFGPLTNKTKQEFENAFENKRKKLSEKVDLEKERIDITLPAIGQELGHLNPITLVRRDIERIFSSMGFEIADGPEIETEWHNFDALNVPPNHPARDMQDTFWIKSKKLVLRTHTSPVQIRYMRKHKPPLRIIAPGRIFRNEATDTTHEHTSHQFEALVVGSDISVGNFKFIAQEFFSAFFQQKVKIRLRPSYFPFTEPSFEFDINCLVCSGKGCRSCRFGKWLEIGGAGMVNQNVFVAAGYPKDKYQGFAWGFGLERLAMMKYGIDDIRLIQGGDLRFVNQF